MKAVAVSSEYCLSAQTFNSTYGFLSLAPKRLLFVSYKSLLATRVRKEQHMKVYRTSTSCTILCACALSPMCVNYIVILVSHNAYHTQNSFLCNSHCYLFLTDNDSAFNSALFKIHYASMRSGIR